MGGGPRVNSQRLGVADVGQVGNQLKAVDNLATGRAAALDTEAQNTAETALEVLLGRLVRLVALEAGVRHPRDVLALLEVLRQGQRVLGMPLSTQRQRLEADQQLLGAEGVEAGPEVAQDLDAHTDGEGDGTESLPELEPVVTLRRLDHLGEPLGVLAPVELAAVNHNTRDGGTVPADPLGRRVHDDVGTVVDRAHKVATSTESVVDLDVCQLP